MLSIIQAAGWPIWPLIACSVIAVALIIERFAALRVKNIAPQRLVDEAIAASQQGIPNDQVLDQLENNSPLGMVLAAGFRMLRTHPRASAQDIRSNMEAAGRLAAASIQKHLGALATIASAAPLLGLLGTVIGMIDIFGAQGVEGALQAGGGNPVQLAHGISVALYNTAFGLMVAIPTLIFWRYFRARADLHLLTLEASAERFAQHLQSMRR